MLRLMRQKHAGDAYRIHIGRIHRDILARRVFQNKAHIKACVVRDKDRALAELQKFRQHLFNLRRVHHHFVADACQLLDPKRDRRFRIDKRRKFIHDLSVRHLYRADLDDPVFDRGKACRLNIEYHIGIPQRLPLIPRDDFL